MTESTHVPRENPLIAEMPGQASRGHAADLKELCALAVEGLPPMFIASEQLFCYRRKLVDDRLVCEGISERYTIIALLGLAAWERSGARSPIDAARVMPRLLEDLNWPKGIGDLGLLLWLCAEVSPKAVDRLLGEIDLESALARFRDGREGRTTEVAWFLTGLSQAMLAMRQSPVKLRNAARQAYELLRRNQGPAGIFRHMRTPRTLAAMLRSHIGCFADQVYPIVALTAYAEVSGQTEALHQAKACAEAICRAQGPLGQWWWHYNSSTGAAIGRYPVYSVHQDGMAPMALLVLSKAGGGDYLEAVYKGLDWIYGANELSVNLCDGVRQVIWRSIQPEGKYSTFLAGALGTLGLKRALDVQQLRINCQCRPYEFGWLLYAFSGHEYRGRTGVSRQAIHSTV